MVVLVRRSGEVQRQVLHPGLSNDNTAKHTATVLKLVSPAGGQEQAYSSIPVKQEGDYLVVRRPKEYSRLAEAQRKMVPDVEYTLTEAAALSDLPRKTWLALVRPKKNDGLVRVPCRVVNGLRLIKGADILRVVDDMEHLPEHLKLLRDLAAKVDRSYHRLTMLVVHHEGSDFVPYKRNSDAKTILIPIYTVPGDLKFYVDARDFDYVQNDHSLRNNLLSWEDAQKYLEDRGIDLSEVQLKQGLLALLEKKDKSKFRSFKYVSPDGVETFIPVLLLSCGGHKPGICYRLRETDVERLYAAAKRDQEVFVQYTHALGALGIESPTECLSLKPRVFHLDGKTHSICLYEKGGRRYIRRLDIPVFRAWKELEDGKASGGKFIDIKQDVCHATARDNKERVYPKFLATLVHDDNGFSVRISSDYRILLRIRELEGLYYAGSAYAESLRFLMNMNASKRVRTKALANLMKELDGVADIENADPLLVLRFWIARSSFHLEPFRRNPTYFETIMNSDAVIGLFKSFPWSSLPALFARSCQEVSCNY